jgi:2-succinyl-6-hydroxy-2,4-cyclohexadiene-1-carboxylate synthase
VELTRDADGRDLVLLHGFTGSEASWDAVCAQLAGARVLRPTLLGHGNGETARASTFSGEVDRIAGLVRASRFVGAHLVGYSLGARVALGLLVRHPRLFAHATLIGVHPGLDDDAARRHRRAEDEARARVLLDEGVAAFVEEWERHPVLASQRALPASLRRARRRIRLGHAPSGLAAALRTVGLGAMPPLSTRLPAVDVPVTLVVGAHDAKFRAIAESMLRLLPRARLRVVPDAGHDVTLERPAALARLIAEDA